ncbi:putative mycofactocin binding protein MftB [Parafrankia irregularis]|uniref:Putative mycofactocin binding protein MftB n=1 Tax=Parafrankia irregularis TaxID=795642 RepID=A0A0S4QJB7_9ACTN|nr:MULTISPECIES: mycofactocin biosynthesis chaperone MftB [Parafrankia]CUU55170.1 putative mycofactocin binding protein MftB [Parafrankia irregularis]
MSTDTLKDRTLKDRTLEDQTLDAAWELSRSVALRPESFGALAYHFGNRRLIFLKRRELVEVVRGLGDAPDARTALRRAGVPAEQWPSFAAALRGLANADVIRPREPREPEGEAS